jgi:hypothetical protein
MDTFTFDNKISALKELANLNIPELSELFNLNTNPFYFESITKFENDIINRIDFKQKQKLIGKINPNQELKSGDKIVQYWVNETVESIETKTFNWSYFSNPFVINFKEITQIIFFDLELLKKKLFAHQSRYFFVELKTNHLNLILLCFDKVLQESFYICFSEFKLDLDEYDLIQGVSYFSKTIGYKFNQENNIKFDDANNPDSVLLISYLLAVLKKSNLHQVLETIISGGETSEIGYAIIKNWLWYNYIIEFNKIKST